MLVSSTKIFGRDKFTHFLNLSRRCLKPIFLFQSFKLNYISGKQNQLMNAYVASMICVNIQFSICYCLMTFNKYIINSLSEVCYIDLDDDWIV